MPGARCTRSLVCKGRKHTSVVATVAPVHPAFPHAMVLTVSFVLSPMIGLCCHRRLRIWLCLRPVWRPGRDRAHQTTERTLGTS
jgi:hypothetical protein